LSPSTEVDLFDAKETVMRTKVGAIVLLVVALIAPAMDAVAGQKSDGHIAKGTVVFRAEARLGAATIPAGKYVASIVGDSDPELVLSKDGKEVARAAVDRHESSSEMPYDQVRIGASATGVNEVVAVTFKGRRDTFTIRSAEQIATSAKP